VYRLIIPKVRIDDAGSYRVEATNKSNEKASSSAVLTINALVKAPEILDGLKNVAVDQGAKAIFQVHVRGKPSVVIWYKNGVQLNANNHILIDTVDDSHFRLTLLNTDLDDQGEYKVRLENEAGSADSEAALMVTRVVPRQETQQEQMEAEAVLTITKILKDQTAKEGDNVGFDVDFSGSPTTIKWYKNGQLLSPSDHVKLIDLGGNCFRLLLTDVQKEEHEASYKVEAEKDGHIVHSTARLFVEGQAPRILKALKDYQVTSGSKIILETEVEGKPKTVKWYKNGREIKQTDKVKFEELNRKVFRLIFQEVQKNDEATYKIILGNDFGACESEGHLTVEEKLTKEEISALKFIRSLTDKTVTEGSHISLEIEVEGKPKSIKWYKNGRSLNESEKIRIEKLSESVFKLMIMNTSVDDQGDYRVVVENDVSRIESQGKLNVESARPTQEAEGVGAKFTVPLTSQTGNEDETISLTCRVRGEPFPEIAW
uniref:Ig-like domain-containing protein n=1 Tax=Romanomermis culicivorax TaxID=13658 RepID=A0A915I7E4_ROMCU